MVVGLLIAAVVLLLLWFTVGSKYYAKYVLYKKNEQAIKAVEGVGKIVGDVVSDVNTIKGVADAITHGDGNFFSRATGAFSSIVG
jgi:hypothetical protein